MASRATTVGGGHGLPAPPAVSPSKLASLLSPLPLHASCSTSLTPALTLGWKGFISKGESFGGGACSPVELPTDDAGALARRLLARPSLVPFERFNSTLFPKRDRMNRERSRSHNKGPPWSPGRGPMAALQEVTEVSLPNTCGASGADVLVS